MLVAQKTKYHNLYMDIALRLAEESCAVRKQVGAVIVTPLGVLCTGWNGTPPGEDNCCEDTMGATKPSVIHGEVNAITKAKHMHISLEGSILFCTHSPCIYCAQEIIHAGIVAVYFKYPHKARAGCKILKRGGVSSTQM